MKEEHEGPDTLEPRNSKLQSADEADREREGQEQKMRKKMKAFSEGKIVPTDEEVEEMAEGCSGCGDKAQGKAERISDFIEIVIRLPKP